MQNYKIFILFFTFLNFSKAHSYVDTSRLERLLIYPNSIRLDCFISECIKVSTSQVKDIIFYCIQNNYAGINGDKKQSLWLLKNLKEKLAYKVGYIESQIKHKYKYDQEVLKRSLSIILVALGLASGAWCSHQKRVVPAQKELDELKKYLDTQGINVFHYRECIGNNTMRYTTSFIGLCNLTQREFDQVCNKYLSLERQVSDSLTIFLGCTTLIAGIAVGLSICDLWKIDPNRDNNYLDMYKDLLSFVTELEKEFQEL
jgi:hypothetical protein